MDAETIKREALDAILDLQLDSTVSGVTHAGKNWCVQFSGDYGQFCDSFKNQFERDNSPRVIREKIKKHLLAQITQLRNKGGRRATKKAFVDDEPNVAELFQEAVTETTRAIGQAIDRTLGITGAGIQAASDVAESVTARTADLIRPGRPQSKRARGKAVKKESANVKTAGKAERGGTKRKAAAKSSRATGKKKAATKKTGGKKKSARKR
ncbi:MAG: hypothetical protein ICV60_14645 [Pyrinomonadaceae bacterium]|nr:hypothetical protein [Pyrinomonadaceae bacterium]